MFILYFIYIDVVTISVGKDTNNILIIQVISDKM